MAVSTKEIDGKPVLCPQEGPQTEFCSSEADIVIYGGQAYGGKAQPLNALVCTPFGFRRMGDIKIGSQVSNPDGSVARVIAIWPQGYKDVYEIVCDDGSKCECTGEHLWKYRIGREQRKTENQWFIGSTEMLCEKILKKSIVIPLSEPVKFTLPVRKRVEFDPYFLGVLIGDGCTKKHAVSVTTADKEIIDRIPIPYIRVATKPDNKASSYFYKWDTVCNLVDLGLCGKKSHEKFVPEQFIYASIDDRYEILRGLMDTDGYVDDRGHASYTSTSKQLAKDVQFIARSLGFAATITEKQPTFTHNGELKQGLTAYNVWIGGKNIKDIVTIKRKVDRCVNRKKLDRVIVSINKIRVDQCQCITVDHPSGLYITNDFVVTHNSFATLLESTRGVDDPNYTAIIFRRKYIEIFNGGGLWDTSEKVYPSCGGTAVKGNAEWKFPSGCSIKFAHLNNETNKNDYQGAQFVYIAFDELTHFTASQFWYLMSRNRPPAGCTLKPYIRATCNAEPGWVADLIAWWWDPNTGYAIPERSGVIRHFIREGDKIIWVNKEYRDKDGLPPKSITFISSSMDDNPLGMIADPTYRATINSMDYVTRERLGKGNWLIAEGGNMFRPEWFEIVDDLPIGIKMVRYWDFAATEVREEDKNDPDYTSGTKAGVYDGILYIADISFFRESPGTTEKRLKQTCAIDGRDVEIWWEEEKGSAGKFTSQYLKSVFKSYDAHPDPVSGQKVERAKPWSAWAEHGRVKLLRGEWNSKFLMWASQFPNGKRDTIDSTSGAFKVLTGPDRVFKYYISSEKGHYRLFDIDEKAFERLRKESVDVFGVLYCNEIGQIFGAVYAYAKQSCTLRQYGEIICPDPTSGHVVAALKNRLVVPMYDKPEFVSLNKVYCNDAMMEYGKGTIAKDLKKYGLRLHLNTLYDEVGSIHTLNNMMAEDKFRVHQSCFESDAQYRGARYENKKLEPGNELTRCTLILVSQLRADIVAGYSAPTPKQHRRKKLQVRETLKSSGNIIRTTQRSEYDYLV